MSPPRRDYKSVGMIGTAEKLTNSLIRCLENCAKGYNDLFHNIQATGSRCEIKSFAKTTAILDSYAIPIPLGWQELLTELDSYRNNILAATQKLEAENQLDSHIKSLLDNDLITQSRNRLSLGSKIKDDLMALYQPCQARADKIEKLVKALASCLESCVKDCTVPMNRELSTFAFKLRLKITAILKCHDMNQELNWDDFKASYMANSAAFVTLFREHASNCVNLDEHILALYSNADITQNRGHKSSTIKKELEKLLPADLLDENDFVLV